MPRLCAACNSKLNSEENFICYECNLQLEIVTNERLEYEFKRKFLCDGIIDDFISHYIFKEDSVIQRIVHSFKYDNSDHT